MIIQVSKILILCAKNLQQTFDPQKYSHGAEGIGPCATAERFPGKNRYQQVGDVKTSEELLSPAAPSCTRRRFASECTAMREWDEWLRHRIRAYIWKQWKKPKTKQKNLMKLGVPEYCAHMAANSRRGYWFTANTGAVTRGITNERLIREGFFELSPAYESIQTACIGRAVYRTVRTVR